MNAYPLTKLDGELQLLHKAEDDAVDYVTGGRFPLMSGVLQ